MAIVISYDELVLHGVQPAKSCGTVFFRGLGSVLESMLDHSLTVRGFCSVWVELSAVPKDCLVVSVQRNQEILEVMILEIPNGLVLCSLRVLPDSDAVVLSFLGRTIWSDI